MSEPTLEDISDYDTLKGEKKKIVWTVIIVGIVIGALYYIAGQKFNDSQDSIKVHDEITIVPGSKSIPVK
jgi:hypothetical protein